MSEPAKECKTIVKSSIDLDQFDYLIVNCGYTSRLVCHYLELGANFFLVHGEYYKERNSDRDMLLTSKTVKADEFYGDYGYESRPNYEETGLEVIDKEGKRTYHPDMPLFMWDELNGEGLYLACEQDQDAKASKDTHTLLHATVVSKETSNLVQALRETIPTTKSGRPITAGTIGFRCCNSENARRIIKNLIQLGHCGGFHEHWYKSQWIEMVDGQRILQLYFDTESG